MWRGVAVLALVLLPSALAVPKAMRLMSTTNLHQAEAKLTRTPGPCGSSGLICSLNGECTVDPVNNTTTCICDPGFVGASCSETTFFEKTLEATVSGGVVSGYRYHVPEEGDPYRSKTVFNTTAEECMRLCNQEAEFDCRAVNFEIDLGTCFLIESRAIEDATTKSVSYTKGPENCFFGDGESYRGTVNTTATGHVCQSWATQSPNIHSRSITDFPRAGLTENFCRNPDGEDGPWCYTTNGDRWELCAIPACTPRPAAPTPTPECPAGCSAHGNCERDAANIPTGVCLCNPGFKLGPLGDCSEPEPCLNNCSGHGVCEFGLCRCEPEWQAGNGDCSLESIPCSSQCSGHGSCDGSTGNCDCLSGFSGNECELESYPCPFNCSGNGHCDTISGLCACDPSYTGTACNDPVCPNLCSGNGNCDLTLRKCNCDSEHTGADCSEVIQAPCPNDCSGHGSCVNGRCFCQTGFILDDCSEFVAPKCPNDCNGHGSCDDGVCHCEKYYSGSSCEKYTQPHFEPWPVLAIIIPCSLVVAFVFWLFSLCHRVDVADGESDFANLPIIRWFFREQVKMSEITKGELPGSRVRRHFYA